jgi:hypothetical protein
MRIIKMIGLAIVAVLALGAFMASSAMAAAPEFEFSKTGGQFNGKASDTQKFKTGSGATVECSEAKPAGEVTKLLGTELKVSVAYTGCSVLSIGSATFSLAEYTLFIKPNSLSVLNLDHIVAEALGVKCELSVLSGQTLGTAAGEVEYENDGATEVLVKLKVTKIVTDIVKSNSTSLCGKEGEEVTDGTLAGNMEIGLSNGSIQIS